jgi:hypothetical protein
VNVKGGVPVNWTLNDAGSSPALLADVKRGAYLL